MQWIKQDHSHSTRLSCVYSGHGPVDDCGSLFVLLHNAAPLVCSASWVSYCMQNTPSPKQPLFPDLVMYRLRIALKYCNPNFSCALHLSPKASRNPQLRTGIEETWVIIQERRIDLERLMAPWERARSRSVIPTNQYA